MNVGTRPVTPVEFTSHLIGAFFAAHTNTTATLGWTLAEFAQDRLEQGDESFGSAAVVDVRGHRVEPPHFS